MQPLATIRAPGKLVLVGEYAVLDDVPAIVLAIDRGVRCDVYDSDLLEIETPSGDDRFVRPALHGARGRFVFGSWNPVDLPGKPGFGGSAGACVAACVAAGRPATDAFAIHHRVQGSGSGIDVAAAIHGGMLRFRSGTAEPLDHPVVPTIVYSNRSAKTGPRVERYRAWCRSSPSAARRFQAESTALVQAFPQDPLPTLREAGRLLAHMAAAASLPYATPELEEIQREAEALGGAAKFSGAGGGDCAVALLPTPAAHAAFTRRMADLGLPVLPASVAPGAHRDSGAHV